MDELTKAKDALNKRSRDPRLRMVPGLADDLRAIGDALGELERRIGVLAVVEVHAHHNPTVPLHAAVWKSVSEMSDHARALYEIRSHGEHCVCEQCYLLRMAVKR